MTKTLWLIKHLGIFPLKYTDAWLMLVVFSWIFAIRWKTILFDSSGDNQFIEVMGYWSGVAFAQVTRVLTVSSPRMFWSPGWVTQPLHMPYSHWCVNVLEQSGSGSINILFLRLSTEYYFVKTMPLNRHRWVIFVL